MPGANSWKQPCIQQWRDIAFFKELTKMASSDVSFNDEFTSFVSFVKISLSLKCVDLQYLEHGTRTEPCSFEPLE